MSTTSEFARSSYSSVDEEAERLLTDRSQVPEPWALYAQLRESEPIKKVFGMTLVTRHDHVNKLYRDHRLSRHQAAIRESEAHSGAAQDNPLMAEARVANISMLINQDEPAHRRIRRLLDETFRPKAVAAWLPRVQEITDELIAAVGDRTEFDLMEALAYPLPEAVICDLMQVPREDHALWGGWIQTVVAAARNVEPTPEVRRAVVEAHVGFLEYFRALVARRRENPGSDLVSDLIRAEDEGDQLSELELLGTLQMLIAAGSETTSNLIGNAMLCLLHHPEQAEKLREDLSLMPGAVEEFLRLGTPSDWALPRVALEDIDLGDGHVVEKGSVVLLSIGSANRDPRVFTDPERLDITRSENRHISFAAGPHFCLGALLARREASAMIGAILTRWPTLELVEEPTYRPTYVRALKELKVRVR